MPGSTRRPDTSRFCAPNIANLLRLQQQDLTELAGVHRNMLRGLMRVLPTTMAMQPDPQPAIFPMKSEPIPAFHHKTLLQPVRDGRTADAINYLESISAGSAG